MTINTQIVAEITTSQLHHARLKQAQKLATMLDAEYPAIRLNPIRNEIEQVTGWQAFHVAEIEVDSGDEPDTTEEMTQVYEGDKVPTIADLLEQCEELGLDPEGDADEEERVSGSVVREVYRKLYKENSTSGQSCGDWLAEWLTAQTWSPVNGLMVEDLTAILVANGLDMTRPWAKLPESGQNGWRGRYRMNGRQTLEKHVALNGYVLDAQGNQHEVPEDELAGLRAKHAKWIEKQHKAQQAADALAE